MQKTNPTMPSPLSDDELLSAITRDLRTIYADIIRQPLPESLAAVLKRVEAQATSSKVQSAKPSTKEALARLT